MSPSQIKQIREQFVKWVNNHPDVFRNEHFWFVQNCVGDLIMWKESPTNWLTKEQKAKLKLNDEEESYESLLEQITELRFPSKNSKKATRKKTGRSGKQTRKGKR